MDKSNNNKIVIRHILPRLIMMYSFGLLAMVYGFWLLMKQGDFFFDLLIILFGAVAILLHDVFITINNEDITYRRLFKVKHINMSDIDIIELRMIESSDGYSKQMEYVALDKKNKVLFEIDEYMKNTDKFINMAQARGIKTRIIDC